MPEFLRNFNFDRNSFLIGFILGILFWMLLGVIWPLIKRAWASFTTMIDQSRTLASRGIDVHLANDTLLRLQKLHLAAALFSLDEVRVEPRILAPPQGQHPGDEPGILDITSSTIPYLPDATEIAGVYRAPSLGLAEMLSTGANILLIGRAGSGKSFAMADLACRISRKEPDTGDLINLVPLYLHVHDFQPETLEGQSTLSIIIAAALQFASPRTSRQLPGYLENAFSIGRALLMLDGLDELPPEPFDRYVNFLRRLLKEFPAIKVVTTASTVYYGDLTLLGFAPAPIAAWNGIQRTDFIRRWSQLWTRHVNAAVWSGDPSQSGMLDPSATAVDPLFVEGMLLKNQDTYTPLELTALAWAAFAGDMLGNSPSEAIESYIRRMIADIPEAGAALDKLAASFLTQQTASLRRRELGADLSEYSPTDPEGVEVDADLAAQADASGTPSARKYLSRLLSSGLLVAGRQETVAFQHPSLLGYLAGAGLVKSGAADVVTRDLRWEANSLALGYMARIANISSLSSAVLERSRDPLQIELFTLSDQLRNIPKGQPWRTSTLRRLAQIAQDENLPFVLRHRAVVALVTSGETDVARLFRPLLTADDHGNRQLACLACGYIQDAEAVRTLNERMYDTSPAVRRAACLALVNIGSDDSLEQVAAALLHGDDDLRRAAAEAFANHPEEGYPLLKDGVTLDDLLVRRATVFGLYRVGDSWAKSLLQQLQMEDEQWVVRAAATQAFEELERRESLAPRQRMPLHDLPWLIEFASERGMGVTTGKPAQDMLKLALKEGSPAQKIAALSRLAEALDTESLDQAYQLFYTGESDVQESAYLALWDLSRGGFDLPEPVTRYETRTL